jgi:hypothetical protein
VADRICEILKEQGKDQKTLARSLGKIEIVLSEPLIEVTQTIPSQATAKDFSKLSSKSTIYPA